MNASLVFDDKNLYVPDSMGQPKTGQLAGTAHENLGELACRICYDSLGTGRSSTELHRHILDVQNHSIYEHIVFTAVIDLANLGIDPAFIVRALMNRKGIWVEDGVESTQIEITANLRAVLEWERHSRGFNTNYNPYTEALGAVLGRHANDHVPMIIGPPYLGSIGAALHGNSWLKTDNLTNDQANITLYLYGSRGFTHEQVRHRFAISQRSTRYVDEDQSPYNEHPLVTKYLRFLERVNYLTHETAVRKISQSITADRETYRFLVEKLQEFAINEMGIKDKTAARKQARGAARGYLGNALASDMLFTTNVTGWRWIVSQRKNKLADAEIREVYTPGLEALKASQYGDRFMDFVTIPSPDGIGTVLAS